MRILASSGLLRDPCQHNSILRVEEVATPGEQVTDAYCLLAPCGVCLPEFLSPFSFTSFTAFRTVTVLTYSCMKKLSMI